MPENEDQEAPKKEEPKLFGINLNLLVKSISKELPTLFATAIKIAKDIKSKEKEAQDVGVDEEKKE